MACKWIKLCALAFGVALLLLGCGAQVQEDDLTGKSYTYEKDGFGGRFHIQLQEDHQFSYYEGLLSSYIGMGTWNLDGNILTLTDDTGINFVNRFEVDGGDLVFQSEGSTNFMHVKVADGEKFSESLPE